MNLQVMNLQAMMDGMSAQWQRERAETQMTLGLTCVLLLALAGCGERPVERSSTNNAAIQVDTLFTHDGCTVYRFVDDGRYRYFVRCDSGNTRTEWTESCGRNCIHNVEIPGS